MLHFTVTVNQLQSYKRYYTIYVAYKFIISNDRIRDQLITGYMYVAELHIRVYVVF